MCIIVPSKPILYFGTPMNTLYLAECYVSKANSAKKAGKHFDMSFSTFANIRMQTHCAYSGIEFTKDGEHMFSFERIDNSLGYVDGNVIAVSRVINSVRSSLKTVEQVDQQMANVIKNEMIAKELLVELHHQREELKLNPPKVESDTKPIIPANGVNAYYHNWKAWQSLASKNLNYYKLIAQYNEQILKVENSCKKKENKAKKVVSLKNCIIAAQRKILGNEKSIAMYNERMEKLILPRQSNCVGKMKNTEMNIALKSAYDSQMGVINSEIAKNEDIIKRSCRLRGRLVHVRAGIEKFSNLTAIDKMCLKFGYPLGTSKAKIIRQKISGKIANEVH